MRATQRSDEVFRTVISVVIAIVVGGAVGWLVGAVDGREQPSAAEYGDSSAVAGDSRRADSGRFWGVLGKEKTMGYSWEEDITEFGYTGESSKFESHVSHMTGTVFPYSSGDPVEAVTTSDGTFPSWPSSVTFTKPTDSLGDPYDPLCSIYCVISDGAATHMRALGGHPGNEVVDIAGAIYTSGGVLVAYTDVESVQPTAAWREMSFSSPPALEDGIDYALVVWSAESADFWYWQLLGDELSDYSSSTPDVTLTVDNYVEVGGNASSALHEMYSPCTYTQLGEQWYRCILEHSPTTERKPGDGADWETFWRAVGRPAERPGVLYPGRNDTVEWSVE